MPGMGKDMSFDAFKIVVALQMAGRPGQRKLSGILEYFLAGEDVLFK